jgi:hypothetical protein
MGAFKQPCPLLLAECFSSSALPDIEAGDRASDQHALDLGRAFEDREVVRSGNP